MSENVFAHLFTSTFGTIECFIFAVAALTALYFDSRRAQEIAQVAAQADPYERALAAKKLNEGLKLTATLMNNLAVGLFVGGIITPVATGRDPDPMRYVTLTFVSTGYILRDAFCSKI